VSIGPPRGSLSAVVSAEGYPDDLKLAFEQYLEGLVVKSPSEVDGLFSAMRYSLLAGGKRIRPVLAMATQRSLDREPSEILPFAAAVEMIHTYSLIHDDLPAMDNDDLRRGIPTLHKVEGEATAILAGDALYAEAIHHLLTEQQAAPDALVAATVQLTAATGLGGMVGGQYLDVHGLAPDGAKGLLLLHGLKTGALIRASVECVLLLAESAPSSAGTALRTYAEQLGVLFQVVDDILDVSGTEEQIGKPLGSDLRQGRRTYVTEYGLDEAVEMANLLHKAAIDALEPLGSGAAELRVIADHVVTRTV